MLKNKRCLIVAAHPDDEVLGCGAVAARLSGQGAEVYSLILGEGVTSRDSKRDTEKRNGQINNLKKQVKEANNILGIKDVILHDFPDNRFDQTALLDIVKVIEKVKHDLRPNIIFTHYKNDLNIDHRITYDAVITATRPMPEESVNEIYCFEVLSSTEWNYPLTFSPNVFFDVTDTIDIKEKALDIYLSELKAFPHPRSQEGVRLNARSWGMKCGLEYAEAFSLVRMVNKFL